MNRETELAYRERILRVLQHVEANLDGELSLEGLAREALFSPFHFSRIFRVFVGETPMAHLRRLRLERAALRLRATELPVGELVRPAGYESHEAFTRAFRQQFGMPPQEYRERAPEPPPPAATPPRGQIDELPVLRVAFVRHVGPYDEVPNVFERLVAWTRERDAGSREPLLLGIGLDDPSVTPSDRLRFDCCVELAGDVTPAGDVGVREIGGGPHAVATHRGSFDGLAGSYGWLWQSFLPQTGRRPRSGATFEVYLTHPFRTPPPELVTEICLPLED